MIKSGQRVQDRVAILSRNVLCGFQDALTSETRHEPAEMKKK